MIETETRRPAVKLPPTISERQLADLPEFEMDRAELVDGRLVFERAGGMDRAIENGFLLVKVPRDTDLAASDAFCRHFFESKKGGDELDRFRGFRDVRVNGDYQGYFDREHDQWENYYVEMANWGVLPEAVAQVGHRMTDLGIGILRDVLRYVGVGEEHWSQVTSGLSEKRGHQMLAFNHFRPEKAMRGCKFHRDSGWVTILRSHEPGLVALLDDRLYAINPTPGYFIANFGSSIEVTTAALPKPVRANIHGVTQTQRRPDQPHRTSYVVFLDSNLTGDIYRYENGLPRRLQSLTDFAVQEVSRTYDDDNVSL